MKRMRCPTCKKLIGVHRMVVDKRTAKAFKVEHIQYLECCPNFCINRRITEKEFNNRKAEELLQFSHFGWEELPTLLRALGDLI